MLIFIMIGLVSGGTIEVALPALVHGPLHGNASSYGLILAGWGAGALVGAIAAGVLSKGSRKGAIMLLAGLLMAVSIALLPTWGVLGAIVGMLLAGMTGSVVNVVLFTAIQLAIPRHLMGRVMGLLLFGSFGVYPLSVALAGVLSDHLGPGELLPTQRAAAGPGDGIGHAPTRVASDLVNMLQCDSAFIRSSKAIKRSERNRACRTSH